MGSTLLQFHCNFVGGTIPTSVGNGRTIRILNSTFLQLICNDNSSGDDRTDRVKVPSLTILTEKIRMGNR